MKKNLVKISSNRSFGFLFFVVFLAVSLWPLKSQGDLRLWAFILSLIFLVLGILNSKFLNPLNNIWLKFGELLGRIISPIVMAFVYFLTITPLAFTLRLFGKDLLNIKFNSKNTYWINRKENVGSMRKQF